LPHKNNANKDKNMRATLALDDDLLEKAQALTNLKEKSYQRSSKSLDGTRKCEKISVARR
jgi:hypothetical protein